MNIQKSITIQNAIHSYLEWKQTHTTSAYTTYKIRLQQFAQFISLKANLHEVNGDDIVTFHRSLENKYSLNTIAYSARVLKNFFWFWHGRGMTTFNPKEIIPVRFVSANKDIVTKEDLEDMSSLLDKNVLVDLQKKLVLHLLWDTGMRISELLDIEISNINREVMGYELLKLEHEKVCVIIW